MKKILALVLALCMMAAVIPAVAENESSGLGGLLQYYTRAAQ